MQSELYDVVIPDYTTRRFQVPAYEVPLIRELWKQAIKAPKQITVEPTGIVRSENLHDAMLRCKQAYRMPAPGSKKPAFEAVYPSDNDFAEAYDDAVADTEEALAAMAGAATSEQGAAAGEDAQRPGKKGKG